MKAGGYTTNRVIKIVLGFVFMNATLVGAGNGPGGVGTTDGTSLLRLWLKADAGVQQDDGLGGYAPATNGASVKQWQDQSGYEIHANQTSSTKQPSATNEVALNGMPVVHFDPTGGTKSLQLIHFMDFAEFTIFDVGKLKTSTSTSAGMVFGSCGHRKFPNLQLRWHGSGDQYWMVVNGSVSSFQYLSTGLVRTPHIGAHVLQGQTITAYYNRRPRQNITNTNYVPANFNQLSAPKIGVDANGDNYPLDGDIAELVIFEGALNSLERQIIENHLSAKYDIALYSGDVYAGDTLVNGDYDYDVIGTGQDSDVTHTNSAAAGLTITLAEDTLTNGDYLFAGHKTPVNSLVTDDINPAKTKARWSRVWYADKTGSLDASITFDWSAGGLATNFRTGVQYQLLYSAATPLNFAVLDVTGAVTGDHVTFALADAILSDGYYTLGVPPPSGTLMLMR